jgi:hypothetical protein
VNKLMAFARLTRRDRALLLHALACLVSCRARLRLTKFAKLQAWATDRGVGTEAMERIRWAIGVALRIMPGATCLCQALALQRLLARSGHLSDLRIGVKKCDDDFRAHAWLVNEGRILIGDAGSEQYQVLGASEDRSSLPAPAGTSSPTT